VLLFPACVFGGFALKRGIALEGVVVLHSDWTEISVPHGINSLFMTNHRDLRRGNVTVGERTLGIGIDHKKME
jgi:hypothetical protein